MFVHKNQIYVIEAKVSVGKNKINTINLNNILFKLSALNKNFGLRSHAYLFTLADFSNQSEEFIADLQRKLKVLSINKIFDRQLITDNREFISEIKNM